MNHPIPGLHHVTAIAGDAQRNLDFYTRVLGLRLVKRTVNLADPGVEHLYYGDWSGAPGTIITFFAWPEGERGRQGAGMVGEVAFAIPRSSLAFWSEHLIRHGVRYSGPTRRFEEQVLSFHDGDGLLIELVATADAAAQPGWEGGATPAEHAIRGLHTVTLWEDSPIATSTLLTETFGVRVLATEGSYTRYAFGAGGPGALAQVRNVAGFWQAVIGVGVVHHAAWRTPDGAQQQAWRSKLSAAGLSVTPVMDRRYFQSIYFREPGGVIFEIATDGPGFTVDEPLAQLGMTVQQPPGEQFAFPA